jgi:predicted RNA-binding protein (virulence factor B family)
METGRINKLKVIGKEGENLILTDQEEEVLLIDNNTETDFQVGIEIEVFVYEDGIHGKVATTQLPYAQIDQFAYLEVTDVDDSGAYVDWGFTYDLFIPEELQMEQMKEGKRYLVFILEEQERGRYIGSTSVNSNVYFDEIDVSAGDEVEVLLYEISNMGMNVIVDNLYKGLIFHSDLHKNVREGDRLKAYVKNVREDGKIDIILEPIGYERNIDHNTAIVLKALEENEGVLELTDKSEPFIIKKRLGMSKKAFKRALGALYKNKKIQLFEDRIEIQNS